MSKCFNRFSLSSEFFSVETYSTLPEFFLKLLSVVFRILMLVDQMLERTQKHFIMLLCLVSLCRHAVFGMILSQTGKPEVADSTLYFGHNEVFHWIHLLS